MAYMTQSDRLALLAARGEQQRLTDAAQADDRMEMARMRYPAARPTNGMSADGLSYSVANDFDKQLAQASAEFDARTRSPRFVPGARVEQPDAPDLLRQELIDPVIMARNSYTGTQAQPQKQIQNRIISDNGNIWSVDPLSGQAEQIVTAPPKEVANKEVRYKGPTAFDLLGKPTGSVELTLPEWQSLAPTLPDRVRTNAPVSGYLSNFGRNSDLISPQTVQSTNSTPTLKPKSANPPNIKTKSEFDALPKGATYFNKGKLHRKP
jgi:hypothetical protein